jgi:competence protein ComEA
MGGGSWSTAEARRRERIVTGALLALCLGIGAAVALPRWASRPVAPALAAADIVVHVHGEVHAPGRYTLPWGARVADLLELAGGLTDDADPGLVQSAAQLTDGRTVVVPSRRAPEGERARVDVNTASAQLLTTLPGVGPVTAQRILEGRPYHSVEDLLRVPGIGPARLEALRPRVTL